MISIVVNGREHRFQDGRRASTWAATRHPEWFFGLPDNDDDNWLPTIGELWKNNQLPQIKPTHKNKLTNEEITALFETVGAK